ncbi:flagellar motor protein [Marinibactrum halimedae]|uniref:Flagellar motor protein n=1 Tax=Marinibactrum halimedae TaxID=1444977 RepID=A0AA37T8N8_9GAMM|nr:flagellar motor protein [Marinibactrum halimedae]MCD9459809.1 flagellar motor protein [Marinibactrum halimedae]GLS26998.1 flagellar motor protein [Marinibactrum halimedae]
MDKFSFIGVIVGFAALLGGNFLEGGSWHSLVNGPAALIVIGGTLGAAILQTPKNGLGKALSLFTWVFNPPAYQAQTGIKKIVAWANAARRDGLLGLENLVEREKDTFAKKGLQLLIDGAEPESIRRVLESDLSQKEQQDLYAVQFYESMGGYAPTIGIIGAVMGLIHVMQNLADPSELGPGIAVAFVATIYGVALANLLLLPIANKLKLCVLSESRYKELMIDGLLFIADGENPRLIELKLQGYLH